MMQFFVRFNPYGESGLDGVQAQRRDPDAFAPIKGPDEHWGQDRALMKQGHWTGFSQLVAEDFATQVSQGAIADREKEYLSSSDQFVIRVRRGLLKAVKEFMDGKTPSCAPAGGSTSARSCRARLPFRRQNHGARSRFQSRWKMPDTPLIAPPIREWTRIIEAARVVDGSPYGAKVGETSVGIFEVDGEHYAVGNVCTHICIADQRLSGGLLG